MSTTSFDSAPEGAPVRSDKFEAILAVASAVFLSAGFERASMSEIATRLGGSKGTLYNYFRNKEELFEAFMRRTCGELARTMIEAPITGDVGADLAEIGRRLIAIKFSDVGMAVQRIAFSEAHRFPAIGRLYFDSGPKLGQAQVAEVIAAAVARGDLDVDDAPAAALDFGALVVFGLNESCILALSGPPSPAEAEHVVQRAVAIFLRAYARR